MTNFEHLILIIVSSLVIFQDHGARGSYNVAKDKPATSSSILNGQYMWNAQKAVDGDVDQNVFHDSCFHTQESPSRKTEFMRVDLRGRFTIKRIEIYFANNSGARDRSIGYSLMISNINSTDGPYCYQDHTQNSTNFDLHQIQSCEGTGKYVSIIQKHISTERDEWNQRTGPILEVCEFKVFGCPLGEFGTDCNRTCSNFCIKHTCDPDIGTCTFGCIEDWYGENCNETKNLAYMKSASSSSVLYFTPQWNAQKAVDGYTNNNVWCNTCLHTNNRPGVPAYLTVDLGQMSTINRIEIYFVKYDEPRHQCRHQTENTSLTVPGRSRGYSVILSTGSKNSTCFLDKSSEEMTFDFTQSHRCVGNAETVTIYQPHSSSNHFYPLGPILEICEFKVFGCKSGMFGDRCQYQCPQNCMDTKCDPDAGSCVEGCKGGWIGNKCTKACPEGTYGLNCSDKCGQCRYQTDCYKTSGLCPNGLCEIGVNGSRCEHECPNDTFGFDCSGRCGHCRDRSVCDKKTGACPGGLCERGFHGPNCSNECSHHTYGYNCNQTCGKCRDEADCDKKIGVCPNSLCERGVNGTRCDKDCPNGTYGFDCKGICGYCRDGSNCNKTTGGCPYGLCESGYHESNCTKECAAGFYGYNCLYKCGVCRHGVICNKATGACPNGLCGRGVNGLKCDKVCPNGTFGYNCNETCGQCTTHSFCDVRYGKCRRQRNCLWGITGKNCDEYGTTSGTSVDEVKRELPISAIIGGNVAAFIVIFAVVIIGLAWLRKNQMKLKQKSTNQQYENVHPQENEHQYSSYRDEYSTIAQVELSDFSSSTRDGKNGIYVNGL